MNELLVLLYSVIIIIFSLMLQNKPLIHQNLLRLAEPPNCFVLGRLHTSAFLQTKFVMVLKTVLMALMKTTVCNNVQQSVSLNLYALQPFLPVDCSKARLLFCFFHPKCLPLS